MPSVSRLPSSIISCLYLNLGNCTLQLVRHGRAVRPGLGVICLPDTVIADTLPLEQRGVIIKDVVPGSGAVQAGLR
jgi:S1-C subfamily serine protease